MIVVLDGSLTVSPPSSSDGGDFPSMTIAESLSTLPNPKLSNCATGIVSRTINSPSAFVALSGVGATDTVTKGDTLLMKTKAQFTVRMTFLDPAGGADIVSVVPLYGTMFAEFQPLGTLKLLEVKGSGALAYLISGQS